MDVSALERRIDAELVKSATEYGNIPNLSPSHLLGVDNALAGTAMDFGAYFIPGVGNALSLADAVRNYSDTWSDLKRGKILSSLGNLGSGVLNTLWAIPGIGNIGKGITRLGGGLLRLFGKGGRAARAARGMRTAGKSMAEFGGRLNKAAPKLSGKAMLGGSLGAGALTMVGDSLHEGEYPSREEYRQMGVQRPWFNASENMAEQYGIGNRPAVTGRNTGPTYGAYANNRTYNTARPSYGYNPETYRYERLY